MPDPNKILVKMQERLLAALVNGPSLNCRPYASRQRLDLVQLGKLGDARPQDILRGLLSRSSQATIKARVPMPRGQAAEKPQKLKVAMSIEAADEHGAPLADGPIETESEVREKSPLRAWEEQQAVLKKLHTIFQDARTYEQDTGVPVLYVGFPLLSLPPGSFGGGNSTATRRVLAPLAFIPVSLAVRLGAAPVVELACNKKGIDRVSSNDALITWLEQQTGKPPVDVDPDDEGAHPWQEICGIVSGVCAAMDITVPELFTKPAPAAADETIEDAAGPRPAGGSNEVDITARLNELDLEPAPKSDEQNDTPQILCSAVLGLFPMANQGLLRDMKSMIDTDHLTGPVESFIRLGVSFDSPVVVDPASPPPPAQPKVVAPVVIAEERFVTGSDPCQARAVRLARQCTGLVVHGPPGTGKSQTITNIIGDHLSRGQRVLVVCDKRTALDVVFNRLSHMGLGELCAMVHDPRRDHRDLYRSIRRQLDALDEVTTDAKAESKLEKVDAELKVIHDELTRFRDALTRRPSEHGLNFHELVGEWLSLADFAQSEVAIEGVTLATLDNYSNHVVEVLKRGETIAYGVNPWVAAAGVPLADFLTQPMDKIRATATECEEAARAADAAINPIVPPLAVGVPLRQQAEARTALADALARLIASIEKGILARWASESADGLSRGKRKLDAAIAFVQTFQAGPLDAELLAGMQSRPLEALPIAEQLAKLAAYQEIAGKWYAFLPLRAKSAAAKVVNGYGLTLSADNAGRLQKFLGALRARTELSNLIRELGAVARGSGLQPAQEAFAVVDRPVPSLSSGHFPQPAQSQAALHAQATVVLCDDVLGQSLTAHATVIDLMARVRADAGLSGLADRVAAVLSQPDSAAGLIEGLRQSPPRAAALEKFEETTARAQLFEEKWLAEASANSRSGQACAAVFALLCERVETLEGALRTRQGLGALPLKLRSAVDALMKASVEADRAVNILRREAVAAEISARLAADSHLQNVDRHRLQTAFDHYRELDEQKRKLTRSAILHRWISKQKERMPHKPVPDGPTLKASLVLRLKLSGEKALRLRQVVANGLNTPGGDPLFDFCPVWLCSPETVAQVFPLKPVFDVLVFDEASQMRLEESLPVLVRGKRVVIAGDPRQLPPTRFFESAAAASDDDDADNDQDLFEQQQSEVEDLLGAALGLDIQQCYLDVHYRSRHGDLIAFSNDHFYDSRLQPIPGHPSAGGDPLPPVELEHVGGSYERRRNDAEAGRIVEIVKELLSRKEPPSIGIACFNLVQRDLIAERLDELAAEDLVFAKRLEKSRARQGEGSFEGLFVKNLENVQGDERDYILISTTYGPDRAGKFYRRFGPLGRAGGGRRLNVLVTRAREKVHVVTSIPPEAYRVLPDLETGQTPGGTWLLLAYLKFAETLRRTHEGIPLAASPVDGAGIANPQIATTSPTAIPDPSMATPTVNTDSQPADSQLVNVRPTKAPSAFAQALAQRLATDHGVGSDVHWGNEGFCIDLALRDPSGPHNITIGVLCDAARFAAADDPMQWDIFRSGILESQGWKLHRLWTPHFFRDPVGQAKAVVAGAKQSSEE